MDEDAVFCALADANRRRLLERVHRDSGRTQLQLCAGLSISRQAVSKHLAILERARLIYRRRAGRERLHYINLLSINEIVKCWFGKFEPPVVAELPDLKR